MFAFISWLFSFTGIIVTFIVGGGLYIFFEEILYYFIKGSTLLFLEIAVTAAPIVWQVAQELMISLNLSLHINTAWTMLPEDARGFLAFMQIPEILGILITAMLTRFVLRAVPFL